MADNRVNMRPKSADIFEDWNLVTDGGAAQELLKQLVHSGVNRVFSDVCSGDYIFPFFSTKNGVGRGPIEEICMWDDVECWLSIDIMAMCEKEKARREDLDGEELEQHKEEEKAIIAYLQRAIDVLKS